MTLANFHVLDTRSINFIWYLKLGVEASAVVYETLFLPQIFPFPTPNIFWDNCIWKNISSRGELESKHCPHTTLVHMFTSMVPSIPLLYISFAPAFIFMKTKTKKSDLRRCLASLYSYGPPYVHSIHANTICLHIFIIILGWLYHFQVHTQAIELISKDIFNYSGGRALSYLVN